MQHASHVAAKPLLVGEPFMAVASGGVPPVNTPHTADATQVCGCGCVHGCAYACM